MPRTRYDFYIDVEALEGLRFVKERDGVMPSEQIRRAVDRWLAQKGVKKKAERTRAITPAHAPDPSNRKGDPQR
jgi:hypothetical protein